VPRWNDFRHFVVADASKQAPNAKAVPERKFTSILLPEIAHGIPL
jgi:hypothetical protein